MEKVVEQTMYAARWLLAPIYLGLSLAIVALGIKFFQEGLARVAQYFGHQ